MKLNNRGFAISSILYIILIMAVILVSLTLTILTSRKLIIEKIRKETLDNFYNRINISYDEVLNVLKEEVISYATANNITKDSVKIGDFDSSISKKIINNYKLSDNYLTVELDSSKYNVYLGEKEVITENKKEVIDLIDIIDYKIVGNSIQENDPYPFSPVEVLSVGDKVTDDTDSNYGKYNIPIVMKSKNLLDNTKLEVSDDSNAKWEITETGIRQTKLSSNGNVEVTLYDITDLVKPNTKYYFYREIERNYQEKTVLNKQYSGNLSIVIDGSDGKTTKNISPYTNSVSITMPSTINSVLLKTKTVFKDTAIKDFDSNTEYYFEWFNLYVGEKPYTDGSLYKTPITTNIYLDEPLRSVYSFGGISDSINYSSEKLIRNVNEYVITGNEKNDYGYDWIYEESSNSFMNGVLKIHKWQISSPYDFCNYYGKTSTGQDYYYALQTDFVNVHWIKIYDINYQGADSKDSFVAYLKNLYDNNVPIKITYPVYPDRNTSSLKFPKIDTDIGTRIISVDTDIEPSSVEFTVIKKIKQL